MERATPNRSLRAEYLCQDCLSHGHNRALEKAGHTERVDHRRRLADKLLARRCDVLPTTPGEASFEDLLTRY